jgi:hypothetical protein
MTMERKRKLDLDTPGTAANGRPSSAGRDGGGGCADGEAGVCPYTGVPYSSKYYGILKTRQGELGGVWVGEECGRRGNKKQQQRRRTATSPRLSLTNLPSQKNKHKN